MKPVDAFTATQRNLPHWQDPGAVYFLTWRVAKGNHLEPEDRTLALNAILHWNSTRWVVYAAVVMPDHVHVLARMLPLEAENTHSKGYWSLSEVLKSVKGFSANVINRRQKRKGTFWQDETFDRIVRDNAEFEEKWNYIRNNPVKTELVQVPEEYPWLFESKAEQY